MAKAVLNEKKILVLGGGGRKHELVWHLKNSGEQVECAPGSDAIARLVPTWSFSSIEDLAQKLDRHVIREVIVGPEKYLAEGVSEALTAKGISVWGPSASAARLETDKAWAKSFCERHQIPTARAKTVTLPSEIDAALQSFRPPFVVKAAGLAAGKGVWIGEDASQAAAFAKESLKAHASVVIEEFLDGEEISYFLLVDGDRPIFLGGAQDHKRLLENDRGPNTGGMGAYSPVPILSHSLNQKIETRVVEKVLAGLKNDKLAYRGFLFIGLMIVADEPYVLEFNCRMGDPETQSVLMTLKSPLMELIDSLKSGSPVRAQFHSETVGMNVVLAAKGYPDNPEGNFELIGIDQPPSGVEVFHAGTAWNGSAWVAKGGRLVAITTRQASLLDCQNLLYPWIESLPFLSHVSFRRDIGVKAYRHWQGLAS